MVTDEVGVVFRAGQEPLYVHLPGKSSARAIDVG
jgi:hypothetical protein